MLGDGHANIERRGPQQLPRYRVYARCRSHRATHIKCTTSGKTTYCVALIFEGSPSMLWLLLLVLRLPITSTPSRILYRQQFPCEYADCFGCVRSLDCLSTLEWLVLGTERLNTAFADFMRHLCTEMMSA